MPYLKIKKLFEKITDKIKSYEEVGMAAELRGNNSGNITLTTDTYQNPLIGHSNALLFGADGTPSTLTTTTQQNDLYIVNPSTGKITIRKAGHYLVIGSVYAYSGFTAEDILRIRLQINDTNVARFYAPERMSGIYQIIFQCHSYVASANDTINIAVQSGTAARGVVTSGTPTTLQVIRVA